MHPPLIGCHVPFSQSNAGFPEQTSPQESPFWHGSPLLIPSLHENGAVIGAGFGFGGGGLPCTVGSLPMIPPHAIALVATETVTTNAGRSLFFDFTTVAQCSVHTGGERRDFR